MVFRQKFKKGDRVWMVSDYSIVPRGTEGVVVGSYNIPQTFGSLNVVSVSWKNFDGIPCEGNSNTVWRVVAKWLSHNNPAEEPFEDYEWFTEPAKLIAILVIVFLVLVAVGAFIEAL